ncbi:MAG TPA: type II toxin-antitoxin system RelE/ParE family toxin [Candidatus Hodarchaeales archaeon]|nr:type II toxin-antitoxin system RelE/ParE family toxin [Candidatus Hodarchaeales archaeon]HLC84285.1 type II toxin-antitoxin system RelE/ParE family toxin [Candidatus Nanoarchaeia archaeon]
MSFRIEWHPQAFKYLESLPKELIKRVLAKLDKVVLEPFRYVEHYSGEDVYKLRVGDYRALIDIDQKEMMIFIQQFDHRGRIYKR